MLNQHSYSQSEPRRHIAARLSTDENGTLGPDLKNIQRLLTRDQPVRGEKKERLGLCLQERDGSKTGASAPFTHPPTSMES